MGRILTEKEAEIARLKAIEQQKKQKEKEEDSVNANAEEARSEDIAKEKDSLNESAADQQVTKNENESEQNIFVYGELNGLQEFDADNPWKELTFSSNNHGDHCEIISDTKISMHGSSK